MVLQESRIDTLKQLFECLKRAELYLKNRRQFEEADAVKFAREYLIEDAFRGIDDGLRENY